MTVKCWVVDLKSITVEAETEEEAREKAVKELASEGTEIDNVLELYEVN